MADNINKDAKETLETFKETNENIKELNTALEKTQEAIKKINDLAKEASDNFSEDKVKKLNDSFEDVTNKGESLASVIDKIGKSISGKFDDGTDSAKKLADSVKDVEAGIKSGDPSRLFSELKKEMAAVVSGTSDMSTSFGKLTKFMGTKWRIAAVASIGAVSGLRQGILNTMGVLKGLGGLLSASVKGLANFAMSIVSIPFKLLSLLFEVSATGPMNTELAQAIEDVRKEFGHLNNEVAGATFEMSKNLDGFKQTGLSTWRVFGMMHERLKYFMEMQKEMGYMFDFARKELLDTKGALWAYQKALGMTGEDMKSTAQYSLSMGRTFESTLNEITKHTLAFSGGVIDKRFSRQVVKAVADVKHFGGTTIKQVAAAAAYAKGLRVELEKIVGVMDAFETFDAAAENASKLAQSFGVQVDAFKMVEAQDPATQIDMLRKSFFAAGKSADQFNRQQLRLLAETTGLDEAIAKQVFSQKNQGKSLDEIKKKSEANEKKQLSQAEAMQKVAGAIEKLVKQGERLQGGLFRQFIEGFGQGISLSENFREVMRNLQVSLRVARFEGIKLGKEFIKMFPGLEAIATNLAKLYDPKKIEEFFGKISNIFRDYFNDFTSNSGPASFKKLMTNLDEHFWSFFDSKTPQGKGMLDGLKDFFKAFSKIFSGAAHYLMTEIGRALSDVANIIKNPKGLKGDISSAASGTGGFVYELISPIVKAIVDAWPVLYKGLKDLFFVALEKTYKFLSGSNAAKGFMIGIGGVIFGPVIVRTLISMLGAILVKVFNEGFMYAIKNSDKVVALISKLFGTAAGKAAGAATGIGFVVAMSLSISEGMKKYKGVIEGSFSDAERTVAAGAAGILDSLTLGLMPDFLLNMIAQFFAQMAQKIKDTLNGVLGGFGDDILNLYSGFMKVFSGIGDVLMGIFEGDESRLGKGLLDLFEGLVKIIWNSVELITIKLPFMAIKWLSKAVAVILAAITKGISRILELVGFDSAATAVRDFAKEFIKAGNIVGQVIDYMMEGWNDLFGLAGKAFSFLRGENDKTAQNVEKNVKKADVTAKKKEKSSFSIGNIVDLDPEKFKSMGMGELGEISSAANEINKLQEEMEKISEDSIYKLTQQVTSIFGTDGGMKKIVDALNEIQHDDVKSAAVAMSEYSKLVKSSAEVMNAGGVGQVLAAVDSMVQAANEVDESLSKIGKIDVIARLKTVANNIGLGGKMKYQIKNKDVNIELNLTVVMDADKVEKVVIQRAKSVIRNRLNNAEYNEESIKGASPIIPLGVKEIPAIGNGYG